MRNRLVIISFFLFIVCIVNAQNSTLLKKTGDVTYCLDSSEFKIGRFYPGQPKSEVLKLLGSPDSTWLNEGPSETHFYRNLKIEYNNRGKIHFFATNCEDYKSPSGIHVGQSRGEIFKILGINPNELPMFNSENQFVNCCYEVYFILVFDQSLILKSLELGNELP